MILRDRLRIGLDMVILAVFIYAAFEAFSFSRRAQYMPLYVSVAGAILSVAIVGLDYRRLRKAGSATSLKSRSIEDYEELAETVEENTGRVRLAAYYLGWMTGYVALVALAGLPVASALFISGFLWVEARMSAIGIAISVAGVVGGLLLITQFMHLRWPPSLIGW